MIWCRSVVGWSLVIQLKYDQIAVCIEIPIGTEVNLVSEGILGSPKIGLGAFVVYCAMYSVRLRVKTMKDIYVFL